ncbi:general odorant-binding protein 99a-like [Topomyia yanbarensis]|uniref:general odorant-binding protein 99a-like n=1 Tax=Topomyia yanbarensis TaxID=2498891 RepID=UPI00273B17FB|nr:general odorant-binding protein 99a-like [Topomyia yanbarensis]
MTVGLRCVLLLLVAVSVASSHTIKSLVAECKQTMPVSDELEKSFLEFQFPPEEQTTRCMIKCIGEKMQLFDTETGFHLDNIRTLLLGADSSKEFSEEQLKCLEKVGDDEQDECGAAFQTYQCFEQEFLEVMKKDEEEQE